MKKTSIHLLITLFCALTYQVIACDAGQPSYISGPAEIEKNNSYSYVMNMTAAYKSSSGGFNDTQWTLVGLGIVGYTNDANFNTLTLNTTGWTLAYGEYDLVAKNAFGGSQCYGCITNTTFTFKVKLFPPRPDLKVEMTSSLADNLLESHTYHVDFKVSNVGNAASPPVSVHVLWTKGDNTFGPVVYPIPNPIAIGGTFTVDDLAIESPDVLEAEENWVLTFSVDPSDLIDERDDTNNTKTYAKKILRNSGFAGGRLKDSDSNLLSVSDFSGSVLWRKGEDSFDIGNFKPGLYVFKTQEGDKIETKKVLKLK